MEDVNGSPQDCGLLEGEIVARFSLCSTCLDQGTAEDAHNKDWVNTQARQWTSIWSNNAAIRVASLPAEWLLFVLISGSPLHYRVRDWSSTFLICLQQWPWGSKLSNLIKRLGGWDLPKKSKRALNQIFQLENVFQLGDLGPLSLLGSRILLLKARVEIWENTNLDLKMIIPGICSILYSFYKGP